MVKGDKANDDYENTLAKLLGFNRYQPNVKGRLDSHTGLVSQTRLGLYIQVSAHGSLISLISGSM